MDYHRLTSVKLAHLHTIMQGASLVRDVCGPDAVGYVIDIKSYFHQLPIALEDTKFNCVQLPSGQIVEDMRLTMGSRSSPAVASTISTVVADALAKRVPGAEPLDLRGETPTDVVAAYRWKGVLVFVFIDDLLCLGAKPEVEAWSTMAYAVLDYLGIGASLSKLHAQPDPGPIVDYVGHTFNLTDGIVQVQEARALELITEIKTVRHNGNINAKQLESLVGKLAFVSEALYVAKPMLRSVFAGLQWAKRKANRLGVRLGGIDVPMRFRLYDSHTVGMALEFFAAALAASAGRSFPRRRRTSDPIIVTDASVDGFGGFIITHDDNGKVLTQRGFKGTWPTRLQSNDVAAAELATVAIALDFFKEDVRGRVVLVLCDNSASVALLRYCRPKSPVMANLLGPIFALLACYDIQLHAQHIAGAENVTADGLSRDLIESFRHLDTVQEIPPHWRIWNTICWNAPFTVVQLLDGVRSSVCISDSIVSFTPSDAASRTWQALLRPRTFSDASITSSGSSQCTLASTPPSPAPPSRRTPTTSLASSLSPTASSPSPSQSRSGTSCSSTRRRRSDSSSSIEDQFPSAQCDGASADCARDGWQQPEQRRVCATQEEPD